MRVMGKG